MTARMPRADVSSAPERGAAPPVRTVRRRRSVLVLVAAIALLAIVVLVSLAVGARQIDLRIIWETFFAPDAADPDQLVVRELRVPRAVIGVMAGAAFGVIAAVLQGATRNPLADPGLLGINSGASLAVVVSIAFFGVGTPFGFIWFAFGGAALAAVLVFAIGQAGPGGASPAKLALTGAAVAAATAPLVTLLLLANDGTLQQFRFWSVGSLSGRGLETAAALWPFLVAGLMGAAWLSGRLNLLALGDDVARGLGVRLGATRLVTALTVIVLAGTATSLAGPIALLGLAVAHAARGLVGADYRWIVALSAVLGGAVLLGSDVIGRVVVAPAELEAGIVAAIIGAPVLIALVRRSKLGAL